MTLLSIVLLLLLPPSWAFAKNPVPASPGCVGTNCLGGDWPTSMAFTYIKDAGITNNERLDFPKTKTVRLASEKIGKNTYRHIHLVIFTEKSGKVIEAITIAEGNSEGEALSDVEVFIVSKRLGRIVEHNLPNIKQQKSQ
jgi:hypothetical protein